jgi:hypothetical protein
MAAIDRPLSRVVAVSGATAEATPCALLEIARVSQHNNRAARITGMLLCAEGEFLHLLEGPAHEVEDLLARIEQDRRNRWLTVLSRERPFFRAFRDWSIGCAVLAGSPDAQALPPGLLFDPGWSAVKRRLPTDRRLEFYRLLERFCEVREGRRGGGEQPGRRAL